MKIVCCVAGAEQFDSVGTLKARVVVGVEIESGYTWNDHGGRMVAYRGALGG